MNPVNIIRGLSNGKLLIRTVNSSTTNRPYLSKDNYLCVLSMHVNYHLKYCNIECSPWLFEHEGTERYHLLHEQILQSFKEIHKTASVVAQIL